MTSQKRHKTSRREASKLSVYSSKTLFFFIVAFSAVVLYSSSKMLKSSRNNLLLNVRVLDNEAAFESQRDLLLKQKKGEEPEKNTRTVLRGRNNTNSKHDSNTNLRSRNKDFDKNSTTGSKPITICQRHSIYLLVLIFSEEAQHLFRDFIRATWCRRQLYGNRRMTCLFMIGESSKKRIFSESVLEEATRYGDVILVSLHDDIRNSTLKLVTSMKWVISNCPDVKFVLRTEGDVIINSEKLMNKVLGGMGNEKFAGGKCGPQIPVRNPLSKYYVSKTEYFPDKFPPICNNMGYILSYDVYRSLYRHATDSDQVPLDHVFVGISLRRINITPRNISNFIRSSAFDIHFDSPKIMCNYVIIHLHGNREDKAIEAWKIMNEKCN